MPFRESVDAVGRRRFLATIASALPVFIATARFSLAQDKSDFPDGYDAVQAAPGSHKVIFENKLVRCSK